MFGFKRTRKVESWYPTFPVANWYPNDLHVDGSRVWLKRGDTRAALCVNERGVLELRQWEERTIIEEEY